MKESMPYKPLSCRHAFFHLVAREHAIQTLELSAEDLRNHISSLEEQVHAIHTLEQTTQGLRNHISSLEEQAQTSNVLLKAWEDRWADLELGVGWRALRALQSFRLHV